MRVLLYLAAYNVNVYNYTNTFLEQDVDGDTLLMLSTTGSIDQLIACGFRTVKQQMTLRKLLPSRCSSSMLMSAGSSSGSTASISAASPQPSRKLTKNELNNLSPQDRCVYLMM